VPVREHWSSRTAFVLAAIGSAVGLGNLIRFPYICRTYGGGAFLIAYLVALATAGVPIMILEFGLGHISEGSAPKAFRKIHPKLEWLGWIASGVGFFIVIYYAVILAWSFSYLYDSFSITEWATNAGVHFEKMLGIDHARGPFDWYNFRWRLFIGLCLTWAAIVASVWRGATTVSKVVYATVLVPWVILIVFVVRGVTLPGAWEGLKVYLQPDLTRLFGPEAGRVWLAAYTQVFFSLSIGFGIMIAYASFLPKKSDLVKNAVVICAADSITAFVAGLAVYGCLGYLAHTSGVPIDDLPVKGLGLAYVAYPRLIGLLPFGRTLFAALFFLMIITLGIDSAFSLLESFAAAVRDKWGMPHWKANLFVGGAGLVLGLPLITGAGIYWVDTMDHFLTFYGLGVVALVECLAVALFFGAKRLRGHINEVSEIKIDKKWDIMIRYIAPLVLLFFIGTETVERLDGAYEGYPRRLEFLGGWLLIILIPLMGLFLQAIPWAKEEEVQTVSETFDKTRPKHNAERR